MFRMTLKCLQDLRAVDVLVVEGKKIKAAHYFTECIQFTYENFEITSSNFCWGRINKFWLVWFGSSRV